jgi:zinc transport system ATP-binding protein
MSAGAAVDLRNVWLTLRREPVLEDVSLTINEGEFLGLIGPNGAGKTVLLKVILGLLRPDRGSVRVLGMSAAEARGKVAYVPQYASFDADFPIRVIDVVLMGRLARGRLLRWHTSADRARALAALDEVGLTGLAGRQVGKLSGGQVQRVLIARALAVDARLMLLDEPTASLDPRAGGELYRLLEDLTARMTVVLVSHDVGVMYRHVGKVACLNRRLHYHESHELTQEMMEQTYGAPVDVVVHAHSHRVLDSHDGKED